MKNINSTIVEVVPHFFLFVFFFFGDNTVENDIRVQTSIIFWASMLCQWGYHVFIEIYHKCGLLVFLVTKCVCFLDDFHVVEEGIIFV